MLQRRAKPKFKKKWDKIVMLLIGIDFLPAVALPGFEKRIN